MKKNVGTIDRGIRIMAGLVYQWLATNGSNWGLFGLLLFLTGIFGWCHPYQLLGISTVDTCCKNSGSTV
jgi:hypothetical protein